MPASAARSIRIKGVVQGVGFRPHIYRLARMNALAGWVYNHQDGVEIHLEGTELALSTFLSALETQLPPAASIREIDVVTVEPTGCRDFAIRESQCSESPTVSISPDLPVCPECLKELFDESDRRFRYPYINCTNCGPRYTVIQELPYDRPKTTMYPWPMCEFCLDQYQDPVNRRFHAEPVACPACGPHYRLTSEDGRVHTDWDAITEAARLLRAGRVVAVKGLGGYHLACDAGQRQAVARLRERKFRKEKPFALMGRDIDVLGRVALLTPSSRALIESSAHPIVLAPAISSPPGVAPDNRKLGVMLPYTPLHHLLFEAEAPELLVMTSANRSSEPIAYQDDDALARLSGLADAFLVGERPIARRVDDSVVRETPLGIVILRRARGYAPAAVTRIPTERPILALGGDLKNSITLVVDGQAFVSQFIGDLEHSDAYHSFQKTVDDLVSMYRVSWNDLLVVSDTHPQFFSTDYARKLAAVDHRLVQHHRAHIASVLAEREAWSEPVVGVSLDGTGYGDDGSIWGGEIFVGSVETGFQRVANLRPAFLAGGDAAARHPVQAAAGFLAQLDDERDYCAPPFDFPRRYRSASELLRKNVRVFETTSMGRLFDTAAALIGFTRAITFEGQAAMWLEQQASPQEMDGYPFPFSGDQLDFRPLLTAVIEDRTRGRAAQEVARAFHLGVAQGLASAVQNLCSANRVGGVVLSGGVFQNALLLVELKTLLEEAGLSVWINQRVPPNDGGISLGQAALAAFGRFDAGVPHSN